MGCGPMLSVAPFWGRLLGVDEGPLEEGGVRMTRGPDETPSPLLAPAFFIRLKEPNVELLLKVNP